ncbi:MULTISPECIES: hypothetical protein [Priestia]|uniref:hypothetical protein n=1 Tax=Priestia TaxID=2800373 RepID=UPI0012D3240B|nr:MULTISPECIES: hypothetical protein [Priestia]
MARQSKIEQYECEDIVSAGLKVDPPKSIRQIAEECTEHAGVQDISYRCCSLY